MSLPNYSISTTIGYGSTGKVMLGIDQTTLKKVAIKIIPRTQLASSYKITQAVERELAVLQLLHHPNLIELYKVLQDETNIYFITEYVPGGELYYILSDKKDHLLSEHEAKHIFKQIASALAWCHAHHICHRDLKPENILFNKEKNQVKIADFGMAIMQPTTKLLKTSCGSPHYASPEIVRGIPYYGPSADVWSTGIILYVLLTGKLPFDDRHVGKLLAKIKMGRFRHVPEWVSSNAKDLIYRMLVVDPNKRTTFKDILYHPWLFTIPKDINDFSIFSLDPNPWQNTVESPLLTDSNDLDGPTRETLKVLWRDLTYDQIISALQEKQPNIQKLTYHLLISRQKRYDSSCEKSHLLQPQPNNHNHHTTSPHHVVSIYKKLHSHVNYRTPKLLISQHYPSKPVLGVSLAHYHQQKPTRQHTTTTITFFQRFMTKKQHYQKEICMSVVANTEYTAAGKLHYILSERFQGTLSGCMYPDGKIVWIGRIGCKTNFFCRIKKVVGDEYRAVIKGNDGLLLNELKELLDVYQEESDHLVLVNGWSEKSRMQFRV